MPPKKSTTTAKKSGASTAAAAPAHASYNGTLISPHNGVATQARLLHRVRRALLTVHDRYGEGCYHQGQSTPPGASRPPHLGLRRLAANSYFYPRSFATRNYLEESDY